MKMKNYVFKSAMLMLSLSLLSSCMPASKLNTDPVINSNNSTVTADASVIPAPPGTLGEPLSQEGVVQDYDEGVQVVASFTGKYAAAYFYDPDDSDEFIVLFDNANVFTIYKPDFNGVGGLISALSEGVFHAAYVRKIVFAADEGELCLNSTKLFPEYCNSGEIITDANPMPLPGKGQEQYYCDLYDDSLVEKTINTAAEYMIAFPGGRSATVFGNRVANESIGKQVATAESNFKRLFERYKIYGIIK